HPHPTSVPQRRRRLSGRRSAVSSRAEGSDAARRRQHARSPGRRDEPSRERGRHGSRLVRPALLVGRVSAEIRGSARGSEPYGAWADTGYNEPSRSATVMGRLEFCARARRQKGQSMRTILPVLSFVALAGVLYACGSSSTKSDEGSGGAGGDETG